MEGRKLKKIFKLLKTSVTTFLELKESLNKHLMKLKTHLKEKRRSRVMLKKQRERLKMKLLWLLSMPNKQRNFLPDLRSLMRSLLLREEQEQKQRKVVQCSKRTLKTLDLALRQLVLTLQLK